MKTGHTFQVTQLHAALVNRARARKQRQQAETETAFVRFIGTRRDRWRKKPRKWEG